VIALKIADLFVKISARTEEFTEGFRQAEKDLKRFENQFKGASQIGKRLESIGQKLMIGVTLPLVAAGTAATKFAMDAQETENLFRVSMGNMADEADAWSKDLSKNLGLNQYELKNSVGMFNQMFNSMKMGTQTSYDMSTSLVQLANDMASFYNLSADEAFTKLRSGITGEAEPLKQLGILIDEATIKTYAYANGIAKQGEELTQQQKVLARYAAIMDQTKNAQGDLARTADSTTNLVRRFKSTIAETAAEFGKHLIPMADNALNRLNSLATWVKELDDEQVKLIITTAKWAASLGVALFASGKLLQMLPSLTLGYKALTSPVVALSGLLNRSVFAYQAVQAGVSTTGEAVRYAVPVIGTMEKAVAGVGKSLTWLAAHPIVAAIAGIGLLVAAIVYARRKAAQETEAMAQDIEARIKQQYETEKAAQEEAFAAKRQLSEEEYQQRLSHLDKEHQAAIQAAEKAHQLEKNRISKRLNEIDREHDTAIKAIRDEYGYVERTTESRTDLARRVHQANIAFLDEAARKARETHDERMKQLDEEYAGRMRMLDEETRLQLEALQGQIDGIDAQTKAEEKAERERKENLRTEQLKAQIALEEDAKRRTELEQDLSDHLADIERRQLLERRDAQKEALREQMEEVKQAAEQRKEQLRLELEQVKQSEIDTLNFKLSNIEAIKDAETRRLEEQIARIQQEREQVEALEVAKYNKAKETLEKEQIALEGALEFKLDKLEEEYQAKLTHEAMIFDATKKRLDDERKAMAAHYIELDRMAAEHAKKQAETIMDMRTLIKTSPSDWYMQQGIQPGDIAPSGGAYTHYQVPGLATGGRVLHPGLVDVGEHGRERLYLPQGAEVEPLQHEKKERNQERPQIIQNVTINSPRQHTPSEERRKYMQAVRQMAMEWSG